MSNELFGRIILYLIGLAHGASLAVYVLHKARRKEDQKPFGGAEDIDASNAPNWCWHCGRDLDPQDDDICDECKIRRLLA